MRILRNMWLDRSQTEKGHRCASNRRDICRIW